MKHVVGFYRALAVCLYVFVEETWHDAQGVARAREMRRR